MVKAPTYEWRCHRCDAINRAHTSKCEKCDFPAIASTEEIETGRVSLGREEAITPREKFVRGVVVLGYGAIFLGAVFLRIALGTSWIGTSIGAALVVSGLCLVGAMSRVES